MKAVLYEFECKLYDPARTTVSINSCAALLFLQLVQLKLFVSFQKNKKTIGVKNVNPLGAKKKHIKKVLEWPKQVRCVPVAFAFFFIMCTVMKCNYCNLNRSPLGHFLLYCHHLDCVQSAVACDWIQQKSAWYLRTTNRDGHKSSHVIINLYTRDRPFRSASSGVHQVSHRSRRIFPGFK